MTERLSEQHDQHEKFDVLKNAEHKVLPKSEKVGEAAAHEQAAHKHAEQARNKIEQAAEHDDPIARLEAAEKASGVELPTHVNQDLKKLTLRRQLQHIQRQLPAGDRTLSKIIHQPVVRVVSEAAGKTISRPSGLLGGGLVAFLGTSGYLYLAKHLGFTYNSFVFIALFVGGFLIGLALEFAVWLATASRRRTND
jgi:hypothetical protein